MDPEKGFLSTRDPDQTVVGFLPDTILQVMFFFSPSSKVIYNLDLNGQQNDLDIKTDYTIIQLFYFLSSI